MADPQAVVQRIEQRLEAQVARLERAQKTTLITGVIVLVIICVYMGFLITTVSNLMTPQSVSEITMGYVQQYVPQVREQVTEMITEESDVYADRALSIAEERIPQARVQLEQAALKEFNALMVELEVQLDELANYAIDTHRDQVNEWLSYLDSDTEAAALEEELYAMLMEPVYQSNAHIDLMAYAQTLDGIAEKIETLNKPEGQLTQAEELERQILIALKSVSDREAP